MLIPDLDELRDRRDEERVASRIRARFQPVLQVAGLPPHHTPHSLHTFNSLPVSGASLAYVKEQMQHASLSMTDDVYGSWLPKSHVAAVNRVFGPGGPWPRW